jgi:mannitol operon transcriptional antiterminator
MPAEERKLLLLIRLFYETDAIKVQTLAHELNTSITTIGTDLDDLTEWLSRFGIKVLRKRGVGVLVDGREDGKREALRNYLLMFFHQDLFEKLILLDKKNMSYEEPVILHCLKREYVLSVNDILSSKIQTNNSLKKLADSDYIGLFVAICISLQRNEAGFPIEDGNFFESGLKHSDEYSLLKEISSGLDDKLTEKDVEFLTIILKGSKLREARSFYYDSVLIGRGIKKMIEDVSFQLNIDMTADFSLFQGLLAHMEPAVYRISQQMGLFNPLTDDIKTNYPVLFMAVSNSLEKEFEEMKFPDDEIAYLVLHFGSALELRKEEMEIKALIVCPTGIGTSKMLASRLKKELNEISYVKIASIKELKQVPIKNYDVIISTVRLPFDDYVLVNPLLSEEDIKSVRIYLKKNIKKLTEKKEYSLTNKEETVRSLEEKRPLLSIIEELESGLGTMKSILTNLEVYSLTNQGDYQSCIRHMVERCKERGSVTDIQEVMDQLLAREAKGGLGIPGTSLALFHCRHQGINDFIFHIAHLNRPYMLKGMNGKPVECRNLLLLLAPEHVSTQQLEILSMVSTSIVEDREAIFIFSSANEQMVRSKLEETLHEHLVNNIVKE